MKRFLLSLCAVMIFAVAPVSAKKKKADAVNTHGYEGTISQDGCLNCGNWEAAQQKVAPKEYKAWKAGDKDAYKEMQDKTRAGCKAQEDQLAAYRRALAVEDYLAAADLTIYPWVKVSMLASTAKQLLNTIDNTETAHAGTLDAAEALFEKAQKLKDGLGEQCATATNSVAKINERLEVYQGRIDRGLLFIARCRGDEPWPKEE